MVIIRDDAFASFYLPSPTCQSWGIASHGGILLGDPLPLSLLHSDNTHHHVPLTDVDTCVADVLQLMNSPAPSLSFSSSDPSSNSTVPSSEGSMNVLRSILRGHSSSTSNGTFTTTTSSSSSSNNKNSKSKASSNRHSTRFLKNNGVTESTGSSGGIGGSGGAGGSFGQSSGGCPSTAAAHTPQGQGLGQGLAHGLKGGVDAIDVSTRASPGTSPCTSTGATTTTTHNTATARSNSNTASNNNNTTTATANNNNNNNNKNNSNSNNKNSNKSTRMSLEDFLSSSWITSAGCDSTGTSHSAMSHPHIN